MWEYCWHIRRVALMSLVLFTVGTKLTDPFAPFLFSNDGNRGGICLNEQTTTSYLGVFDRIEDSDQAVILIEEIDLEIITPVDKLPYGSGEGVWLSIEVDSNTGTLLNIVIDSDRSKEQKDKSMKLLEKLRDK